MSISTSLRFFTKFVFSRILRLHRSVKFVTSHLMILKKAAIPENNPILLSKDF